MKPIQVFLLLLMIPLMPCFAIAADLDTEATDVLTRYLHALTRGDTDEAKSLMGGVLFQRRQRMFSNPDYRQYLFNKYENAHFEFLSTQHLDGNKVNVSVLTELENGDRFTFIYTIVRERDQSIHIVAESLPQSMPDN